MFEPSIGFAIQSSQRSCAGVLAGSDLLNLSLGLVRDVARLITRVAFGQDLFADLELECEFASVLLVEHRVGQDETAGRTCRAEHRQAAGPRLTGEYRR